MKLKHLPVIISGSLVVVSMTSGIGQAATVATYSINSSTFNTSAVAQCTLTSCDFSNGNNIGTGGLPLAATNQTVFRYNDAPYAITGIDYLLQGSDASNFSWNPTPNSNASNIFSNVQVLNNGTELSFSGGNIAPDAYFSVTRNYNPQSTNLLDPIVTVTYAVPEPTSPLLDTLVFGALGVGYLLKHQSKKQKLSATKAG